MGPKVKHFYKVCVELISDSWCSRLLLINVAIENLIDCALALTISHDL